MTWSKTSRQSRGYGAHWDKLRAQILERDCHLCQCPDCQGGKVRALPAHEVDHIKPKAWFKSGKATGIRTATVELSLTTSKSGIGIVEVPAPVGP